MFNNVLRKCVSILKEEAGSKEYVLGMLETLIEMGEKEHNIMSYSNINDRDISTHGLGVNSQLQSPITNTASIQNMVEEDIPAFLKPGKIVEL